MTNEEAKKMLKAKLECLKHETSGTDYACNQHLCEGCSLNYEQGNMGEQKEALNIAIKALEQTRWISVSERLPKKYEIVLLTSIWHEVKKAVYIGDGLFDIIINNLQKEEVIAWMPIPEPYVPDINVGEMGESED